MEESSTTPAIKRWAVLLGLGVVVFVLGVKLGLIHHYGTDQPYLDQWAAEGVGFLQAPLHGGLNWASFFWPHGEHRPAITRLITRGLIVANGGQWDCYVEIVFNLSLYAALLVVAWRFTLKVARGGWLLVMAPFMAVLFAAPCACENLLWGFQSQFIFLLFCGLLHIYGTSRSMRIDGGWWLAQIAGFCGLFSIAAGGMSAALLVFWAIVEILRGRRDAWVWSTFFVSIVLLAYSLWLLPNGVISTGHRWDHLRQVGIGTSDLLSWPMRDARWWILLQAPCIITFALWCRRPAGSEFDGKPALIGLWVVLVTFAMAYGRVISPDTIGVRYFDVLLMGIFANGLSLVAMLMRSKDRLAWFWRTLGLGWLLTVSVGFWSFNKPSFSGAMLRQQRIYALEQKQVVREFIASDNVAVMNEFENRTHLFPHFQLTLGLLRDKQVQPLLPPSLSTIANVGPLSRLAPVLSGSWRLWIAAGLLLLVGGAWACWKDCRNWD